MSRLENKKNIEDDITEVLLALVYLDNIKDMQYFCNDLFTDKELETIALRWKAVRMLSAGITYTKIVEATGLSSATISRLAKLLAKRTSGFASFIREVQL